MKKSFKRIASLVLAFSMLCTMAPAAFAVDDPGVMNPATGVTGELTEGNSNESGAPVENGDRGSCSEDAGGGEEDPDPSGSNSNESEGVQDGMTAPNAAETPADPAPAPDVTAPADDPLADNAVDPGVPVANANPHYYVANDKAGGDDNANTGERGSPFMTLNKAIEVAQAAGAKSLTITLLSDIRLSQQFDLTASFPITIESDGNHKIQFVGTQSIGTDAGLFAVTNGAEVTFRNITLEGSTGDFDGRVLYAANGGTITLENAVVRKGLVNNTNTAVGGAGAYAADRGTILVKTGTVFEQNKTTAGGGAIFVADGGTGEISNDAALRNNNANLGGAVYADEQTKAYGGLRISGTVSISGNKATVNGAGMYTCKNAKASVQGDVTIHGNQIGAEENNVYLAADATLDISGATTGANIGITPDPSVAYRLVSKPNGHTIAPTKNGDEKGWSDDTGVWDIRYMLYKGQPGLYLYYKTLGMTFEDVTTLTGISGKDINGETKDFLNGGMPNCNVAGSKLTVADSVAKNTPEDDDLTITFTADKNNYRIPTQDVVHVTSGGQEIPFTYNPDFANGTATITIDDAEIDKLTADLAFTITAEKYYTLKLKMEGPLYAMTTDITGLTEDVIVLSEHNKVGTTATYKLTQAGKPVFGVKISLYPEGDLGQAAVIATTNDEGIANFTGLDEHKNYEPYLAYECDYRVIARDRMDLDLSTLDGQTLAQDYVCTPTDVVTYDAGQKTAVITGLAADTTVTFSVEGVKDKIYFHGNEGDATSAPAVLSMESKDMPEAAHTYGELATASLTGYTFLGWFTDPVAGDMDTLLLLASAGGLKSDEDFDSFTIHASSELDLMRSSNDFRRISADPINAYRKVLDYAATIYDYVVIDVAGAINPMVAMLLKQSDFVLLTVSQNLKHIERMQNDNVTTTLPALKDKDCGVVITRYSPLPYLDVKKVCKLLECDDAFTLSEDMEVHKHACLHAIKDYVSGLYSDGKGLKGFLGKKGEESPVGGELDVLANTIFGLHEAESAGEVDV